MILFSSALELTENKINSMNNLIIDATGNNILLAIIIDKSFYTCDHDNSKSNFEKLIVLIDNFLKDNKIKINNVNNIYVNRGPGSFAGIRNSLSVVKGLFLTQKIDYYSFSFNDFNASDQISHKNLPNLCNKYKIKKNLINPLYLS